MRQIRAALICAVAAISLLVSPGTAQAGIEDASDGAGFGVRVGFSGDGAPSGGGSTVVRMPASCWWTPINYMGFQQDNPSSWVEWYDTVVRELRDHAHAAIAYFQMGPRSMYEAAAASPNANALDLYGIDCRDDATYCSGILMSYAGTPQVYDPGGCPVPVTHRFFAGATPQPLVDPEDLAQVARDYMAIPDPVAERNPKLDIAGGSTLVSLPTWFWVTNPDAVGAATGGTRTIRAQAGPVWAEVVAQTSGLSISSPAGGTSCPPDRAVRVYAPGADDSTGCTVAFEAASVRYADGYPVDLSTSWSATWTGSGGTGGVLPGLSRTVTTNVPVAESQALVYSYR
ncbi:MAG: hypothetical protein IPI13_11940 [Actinomycetales bacterium]|jgi:hypothetical protein|uniref:Uncharacterized protein n=1 Tax=Candidatus Phosphoribacter hodrii TaxID=2953743 RepID=A0A935MAL1_9MICO|nr:hypothetical protein [Candidatus Phosphoribacter hodrii]OPZ56533.1 MAG: hypothetical protein BWY91_00297 [bacterium ADurb.BinA028]HPV78758.1 hypothetical protein [Dermatophilaceae bacterium]HQG11819.1 hypothetical protein [Dermatophilaceae bacterium]HQH90955.1 hypothetical protein [Dermatophilaceae bacterium]